MTPTGWLITVIASFSGIAIGYFAFRYFPNLFRKDEKMQEVLNDPHLLLEKLKSHGEIVDMGKKINLKVGTDPETGKEVVMVEEIEIKKQKEEKKAPVKEKTSIKKRGKKEAKKKKQWQRKNRIHGSTMLKK